MKRKYTVESHTIIHGDALAVLRDHIEDGSVDLIFADPPYNIGKKFGDFIDRWPSDEDYAAWCQIWLDLCIRKLSSHGAMYIMTSTQAMPYLDIFLRKKVDIISRIIWSYDSSGVQAKKLYGSMYEPIIFCARDKSNYTFNREDIAVEAKTGAQRKLIDYRKAVPAPYNTQKIPGNVWEFPRVRYRMDEYEDHPTQKPEALLERIIKASSNPHDVVLDPFSGTFTTSAVAKRLGRKSIGIEQDSNYVNIGLRRVLGMSETDGYKLSAPKKNTQRKNAFGIKGYTKATNQALDLFDVNY